MLRGKNKHLFEIEGEFEAEFVFLAKAQKRKANLCLDSNQNIINT